MIRETFVHYVTGVLERDLEHWGLFQCLNKLDTHLEFEELTQVISDIVKLWLEHVHEEEAFMFAIDYPYVKTHCNAHRAMTPKFEALKHKVAEDQFYSLKNMKQDLEKMFKEHIDTMDMQYSQWLYKSDNSDLVVNKQLLSRQIGIDMTQ